MGTRTIIAALALSLLFATPAAADDPAAADALNARARVAYDGGDFAGALALFKQAWGAARLPKYLFNAAKACVRLEDPETALHYYRRYLEAAPGAADADAVGTEMAALRGTLRGRGLVRLDVLSEPSGARFTVDGAAHPEIRLTPAERWLPPGEVMVAVALEGRVGAAESVTLVPEQGGRVQLVLLAPPRTGRLTVDAPPGARVLVGDRSLAPGETLELPPGDLLVRVELAGHLPWVDTVALEAGDDVRLAAAPLPQPPPVRGRGQRVAGWVTLAAGGAALVAGGVLTGLGVQGMNDANRTHGDADAGYVKDFGRGRDLYHGGLGSLGGGAAAALTGGLLLLLAPEAPEGE